MNGGRITAEGKTAGKKYGEDGGSRRSNNDREKKDESVTSSEKKIHHHRTRFTITTYTKV